MQNYSSGVVLIFKGEKYSSNQCPKNKIEQSKIKDIPYASMVRSLMYAQTCSHPNISFAARMLEKF